MSDRCPHVKGDTTMYCEQAELFARERDQAAAACDAIWRVLANRDAEVERLRASMRVAMGVVVRGAAEAETQHARAEAALAEVERLRASATATAGVEYREAFGPAEGVFLRMPCITVRDRKGHQEIPCDKRRIETREEREAEERKWKAHLTKIEAVLKQAAEWRDKAPPWRARYKVLECAACGGRLHLMQSGCNGHVHGSCETDGCARWME